jgi:hypothetical protein
MKMKLSSLALCVVTGIMANTVGAERVGTGGVDEMSNDGVRAAPLSLHERLTQAQGMQLVGPGFYAKHDASGDSYIAINDAGRRALAVEAGARRDELSKRLSRSGISRSEAGTLARMDSVVADLARASAKGQSDRYGGCGNGSLVHVYTNSYTGESAYAYAALELDFSPATPTTNYVEAFNDVDASSMQTTAFSPAEVSVNDPNNISCAANSYARVTCPDGYIAAAAMSFSNKRTPFCLN